MLANCAVGPICYHAHGRHKKYFDSGQRAILACSERSDTSRTLYLPNGLVAMKNFFRALWLALRYRFTIAVIIVSSLVIALLWGANIGAVYPFVEVIFQRDSMHDWVDESIDQAAGNIKELEVEIQEVKGRLALADVRDAQDLQKELDLKLLRMKAEEKAWSMASWLEPAIKRYLPDDPFRTLILMVLIVFVATLVKTAVLGLNLVLVERVAQSTGNELRNRFHNHTLQMDIADVGGSHSGDVMSRFTKNVDDISAGLYTLFGKSIREPLKMLACIVGAAFISWRLLFYSLIICPLALVLMYLLAKSIKRASHRAMEKTSLFYQRLSETLAGIDIVKAFTTERFEQRRFCEATHQVYRKKMRLALYGAFSRLNTELMGTGVICVAILIGGYLVLNEETHIMGIKMVDRALSFGALIVFFGFLAGASDPARKMADVFLQLQNGAAGSDRVYEMLDRQPSIRNPDNPRSFPGDLREIAFHGVNFHYTPEVPVLQDIHLRIATGETLAVVGPNGCGKSTLAKLILRFYDPVDGTITLAGIDLRQLEMNKLRSQIGIVTQQPMLFDETVADNIRYGSPDATDVQVIEAAKKAHAHEFINTALEDGYDTSVGERGSRLSGGQRQRITLARAILRNPTIVVLDEATSQIDPKSENQIHQALEKFLQGRTTLLITHRMSSLTLADRIAVMDKGRIVDTGTHNDLIDRCELYWRMHQGNLKKSA